MIQLSNPDLQHQLLYSFLQFLGVPCISKLFPPNLYIAMDENNIFDNVLSDEKPLTSIDVPLSGFNSIGHMDTMLRGRQHIGHYKDGEEFIQNVFHALYLLFSGKEKSNLSICWLQYEISKVMRNLHITAFVMCDFLVCLCLIRITSQENCFRGLSIQSSKCQLRLLWGQKKKG